MASDHPSIAGVGGRTLGSAFDDDEDAGDLELGAAAKLDLGGSRIGGASTPETYAGAGVTLDDDLFGESEKGNGSVGLELDMPAPPPSPRYPSSGSLKAAPPVSSQRMSPPAPPPQPSSPELGGASVATPTAPSLDVSTPKAPDPASLIARYPAAPTALWEAPIYACRVLYRQFELRQDLASLRRRRSPDVPLYERALNVHDARAFKLGLAITCAALTLATFVFFLPVILRFLRAAD